MAYPPGASTAADTNRRAPVSVDLGPLRDAEVQGNGGNPRALRGTLNDASQLGPPRTKRAGLSRGGPTLNGARATRADAPA
eukprot:535932-Alexandrium_andersonii.AAC.1